MNHVAKSFQILWIIESNKFGLGSDCDSRQKLVCIVAPLLLFGGVDVVIVVGVILMATYKKVSMKEKKYETIIYFWKLYIYIRKLAVIVGEN